MPFAHALEFIRQVQANPRLRQRIALISEEELLKTLVAWGAESGLSFTAPEFEAAFTHDWRVRRLKYSARHPYEASAAEAGGT